MLDRCHQGAHVDFLRRESDRLAASGRRVLAFATSATDNLGAGSLHPVGLVSFIDPLRPTAHATLAACRRASIRIVMVTGDHAATARTIAESAGFPSLDVVTPIDLERLTAAELDETLRRADVVARVNPATKVNLVKAHQRAGAIVAMTGDGVNDAPALRAAEIGVAMGGGSDIAREAASVVITDGDLGRLVDAVAEGRTIHRNLRAVVSYLLSGNLAEIMLVAGALVAFTEIGAPFAPVQLLWVNLITDGLPALGLGGDRATHDPLAEPPRSRSESLVSRRFLVATLPWATTVAVLAMVSAVVARQAGADDGQLRAQLLLSLLVGHLVLPLVARSQHRTFERGWWRGRAVIGAVSLSLAVQIPAFTWGPMRRALSLSPARPEAWILAGATGLLTIVLLDVVRMLMRRRAGVQVEVPT